MQISLNSDCKLVFFADDSAIFLKLFSYANKSPQVISDKLSQALDNCSELAYRQQAFFTSGED